MQPNFNKVKVSANRVKYKIKKHFLIFISEMQPKFSKAKVSANRKQKQNNF